MVKTLYIILYIRLHGKSCFESLSWFLSSQLSIPSFRAIWAGEEGGGGGVVKKRKKNFLIYMEIQKGAVAKSYITNGLLIYDKKLGSPSLYMTLQLLSS
jgi:hypothetical protein